MTSAPAVMRALTIWEPHVSLVIWKIKTSETRGYPAPRGLIGVRFGIHSGLHIPSYAEVLCYPPQLRAALCRMLGVPEPKDPAALRDLVKRMPRGKMLGSAVLTACGQVTRRTEDPELGSTTVRLRVPREYSMDGECVVFTSEDGLGDYSLGRWVWLLDGVERLAEPIPARGYQGLWSVDPEVAAAMSRCA